MDSVHKKMIKTFPLFYQNTPLVWRKSKKMVNMKKEHQDGKSKLQFKSDPSKSHFLISLELGNKTKKNSIDFDKQIQNFQLFSSSFRNEDSIMQSWVI